MKRTWLTGAVLASALFISLVVSATVTYRPFRASGGVQMLPETAWAGTDGSVGIYVRNDAGVVYHKADNTETVLGSGGGGSTGNFSFSGSVLSSSTTTARIVGSDDSGFADEGGFPQVRVAGGSSWQFYSNYFIPLGGADTAHVGLHGYELQNVFSDLFTTKLGSALDSTGSNVTIAPTTMIAHVTNAGSVQTITPPDANFVGCIDLIPDGAFTTVTGGNIAKASTAVVGKELRECFDGTSWYPSY